MNLMFRYSLFPCLKLASCQPPIREFHPYVENKCFPSFSSFIFTQLYLVNCKIFPPGVDPVPQMTESFRRLDPGSGDDHTFITAASARGLQDELYIKGLMGPGLKESIRKVRRVRALQCRSNSVEQGRSNTQSSLL